MTGGAGHASEAEALGTLLHHAYGLSGAVPRRLPGGLRRTYGVHSPAGRFVAKTYRADAAGVAQLARAQAGEARAATAGVPVPEVVPDRGGRRVADGGAFRVLLYRHVPGRHHGAGSFPGPAAAAFGGAIGRLQRAFDGWEPAGLRPDHAWPLDLPGGLHRLERLLRAAEGRTDLPGRRAAEALRWRLRALEALAPALTGLERLPTPWVHGDCNPGNVRFGPGGRVAAVLDFDNLSRLPRGFDLMYALDQSFREPGPTAARALRAYLDEVRPPRAEWERYPRLWLFCDLQNVDDSAGAATAPATGLPGETDVPAPAATWWLTHWRPVTDFFLATYDTWARDR